LRRIACASEARGTGTKLGARVTGLVRDRKASWQVVEARDRGCASRAVEWRAGSKAMYGDRWVHNGIRFS
jgi:hypothetical protein